jgi:hypothetical protein
MTVSEEQATQIAKGFIQANRPPGDLSVAQVPSSVRLDRGGYPTDFLGLGEEYWSLIFNLELLPDMAVMDPDSVIVLVDAQTGEPAWFPVL